MWRNSDSEVPVSRWGRGLVPVLVGYGMLVAYLLLRTEPLVPFAVACPATPNAALLAVGPVAGAVLGLTWRSRPAVLLLGPAPVVFAYPPLTGNPLHPEAVALVYLGGVVAAFAAVEVGWRLRSDERSTQVIFLLALLTVVLVAFTGFLGNVVLGFHGPLYSTTPTTQFDATYDPGNDTLVVRADSRRGLDRGSLFVTVDGRREGVTLVADRTVRTGLWLNGSRWGPDGSAAADRITLGGTVRVRGVDPGSTVRLRWRSAEHRCRAGPLATFENVEQGETGR